MASSWRRANGFSTASIELKTAAGSCSDETLGEWYGREPDSRLGLSRTVCGSSFFLLRSATSSR